MIETNGHVRPGQMDLPQSKIDILVALERVGSSLSLIGITAIVVTYWAFKRMRTVPNLFLLFASIANAGAGVACLIGFDGLRAGIDSALCQTQAFLLEMFMQSDPWWSFAMAVNVFLVFFFGANPASFRKYVWLYCLVCFGFPFIPALACLLIRGEDSRRVYGDATLWCWIGPEWTELRIYLYYLPIWVCIFFSTLIYFAVGYHVFHQRNQLRNLTFSTHEQEGKEMSSSDVRDSADKTEPQNVTGRTDVYGTAVTEVQITTCVPGTWTPPPTRGGPRTTKSTETLGKQTPYDDGPDAMESGSHTRFETTVTSNSAPRNKSDKAESVLSRVRARLRSMDPVKLAYLRTSFVFAVSILVTWTPSSINRVHNLIHPNDESFGLNVASAVVLPLQGVWNAIIYFSTSWVTCKEEMGRTWLGEKIKTRYRRSGRESAGAETGEGDGGVGERGKISREEINDMALELGSVRLGNNVRAMRGSF